VDTVLTIPLVARRPSCLFVLSRRGELADENIAHRATFDLVIAMQRRF